MRRGFLRYLLRAKETGLVVVVLLLGLLLATCGGSVTRVVRDPETGEEIREVEVNKFLQRANLDIILEEQLVDRDYGRRRDRVDHIWRHRPVDRRDLLPGSGGGRDVPTLAGANWSASRCTSAALVVPLAVLVTLSVGALCGLANGVLTVGLRVHPFIVTLGTMSVYRGIAFVTTRAQAITDYPPVFGHVFRSTFADFTILPILIIVAVAVCGYVFLQHTVPGRYVYAVGGNETASRFSGIRIGRIKVLVFTLAGLCGGIAAVICLGIYGSADSSTGRAYELDVIAAAVVGGASLSGGRGTALGAVLGAIVIQLISNGIVILGIDQNYTEIIKGAVIIVAVVFDRLSVSVQQSGLQRAEA